MLDNAVEPGHPFHDSLPPPQQNAIDRGEMFRVCFLNELTSQPKDVPFQEVYIPVKVQKTKECDPSYTMESWPMMDPHSIIAFLYNEAGLTIPVDAVKNYWAKSRANREPWALASDATSSHVPLGLYGDNATVTTKFGKESVLALFLNIPLFRPYSVRSSRFLICAIPEEKLWGDATLTLLYQRIVWSCNLMHVGLHPAVGPRGEDLPDSLAKLSGKPICNPGAVFSVTELRGDWSWTKKLLRVTASWTGNQVCYWCPARANGDWHERYYNFESPSWDGAQYSLPEFLEHQMPSRGPISGSSLVARLFLNHGVNTSKAGGGWRLEIM